MREVFHVMENGPGRTGVVAACRGSLGSGDPVAA
jgi:hypothetical protein